MLLTTVLLSIAAPAIAAVHHRESEEHGRAYQRLMRHLFLVGILLAGVMNLAAGRVVDVLLGSAFAGIRGTVAIYAWSLVPVFVSAGRSRLAIDLGLHHRFLFNGIMAAVVNVALNFLLLPRLGIQGAAWATVIAYTASITVIPQLDPRQRTVQRHLWRAIGLRGTLRA